MTENCTYFDSTPKFFLGSPPFWNFQNLGSPFLKGGGTHYVHTILKTAKSTIIILLHHVVLGHWQIKSLEWFLVFIPQLDISVTLLWITQRMMRYFWVSLWSIRLGMDHEHAIRKHPIKKLLTWKSYHNLTQFCKISIWQ